MTNHKLNLMAATGIAVFAGLVFLIFSYYSYEPGYYPYPPEDTIGFGAHFVRPFVLVFAVLFLLFELVGFFKKFSISQFRHRLGLSILLSLGLNLSIFLITFYLKSNFCLTSASQPIALPFSNCLGWPFSFVFNVAGQIETSFGWYGLAKFFIIDLVFWFLIFWAIVEFTIKKNVRPSR